MAEDPEALSVRCDETEEALAQAQADIETAQRAIALARSRVPLEAAVEPRATVPAWRSAMETTGIPALVVGGLSPIVLAVAAAVMDLAGCNRLGHYVAHGTIARSADLHAPLAAHCTMQLTPIAAGSCRALVLCDGGEGALYRGDVACAKEEREVPGDDGPSSVHIVVARERGAQPVFEYDEGRGTLVVRRADGQETLLSIQSHDGEVEP